jgi:hypothetical protein
MTRAGYQLGWFDIVITRWDEASTSPSIEPAFGVRPFDSDEAPNARLRALRKARAAQQRRDAVDGTLMLCGVHAMLGVEPSDRLDCLFHMDRKNRRRDVQIRP